MFPIIPPGGRGRSRGQVLNIVEHCDQDIDWENARIIGREGSWTQRKLLEGIETLRQKDRGIAPLNQYNQMDQWKGVLHSLFKTDVRTSDVR